MPLPSPHPWAPRRWAIASALLAGGVSCAAPPVAPSVTAEAPGASPESVSEPATEAPPEGAAGAVDAGLAEPEPKRAPTPAAGSPAVPPAQASEDEGLPVHGSLQVRYRGRRTDDADDHDAYATLAMDIGDARRHAFTGHFMGRLWADLGGDDPNDVFFGLDDTFDSVFGILYYAYVDAHGVDSLETLRLGRQQIWETPAFLVFDGVAVEAAEIAGVTFGAYGGLRTQYYDTSAPNDVVAGVYGSGQPWDGSVLRLDYMYLEDEARLGSDQNDLIGVDLRQYLGEELTLEGEFTALEGESRDVRLRAHYLDPLSDLSLQATYYSLLKTQRQQALEVDPYFSTLLEYRPFHQVGVLASKGIGEFLVLNLGLDFRRLDQESDVGEFNHEFDRYYLSTLFRNLLIEGLDLTLIGDVWDDDQQDIQTWGLDLTQRFNEKFQASVGSYYSLFKYDLLLNSERDDVRTYFGKLRYARTETLSFDVWLDYEDDDFEEYLRLVLGARWLF